MLFLINTILLRANRILHPIHFLSRLYTRAFEKSSALFNRPVILLVSLRSWPLFLLISSVQSSSLPLSYFALIFLFHLFDNQFTINCKFQMYFHGGVCM